MRKIDREREGEICGWDARPFDVRHRLGAPRDALSASALHFVTSTLNNRFIKIHGESSERDYIRHLSDHTFPSIIPRPRIPFASRTIISPDNHPTRVAN